MLNKKIIKCRITPMPKSLFDPMPQIFVVLEGEENEQLLLTYYPDEISFTESEILGKTVEECRTLHFQKDKSFLQS
jgi:hypothetical protein